MAVLNNLEPKKVFYYFEEISNIPRGSGDEKQVSDYIVDFAKNRGLEVYQDEYYNVIIKKPGTIGYENAPTVILQGHLDMVCEKNMDKKHDFSKEPIALRIQDDFIMADGTTLGADNGIAVAYSLALLDSNDIPHPPLEVLLTTDEEVGLCGALKFDESKLNGKYFINLDSEEEGELLVSCAGGLKVHLNLPITFKNTTKNSIIKIVIKGLKGGHSGMEIDKNRANANRLLGRLLNVLQKELSFDISDIGGGLKDNAIPREAYVHLAVDEKNLDRFATIVKEEEIKYNHEYENSDPNIQIVIKKIEQTSNVYTDDLKEKLIFLLLTLPNGIQTMSSEIKDLVESSLNIGVIEKTKAQIEIIIAVRSSVESLKYHINDQLKLFANITGASFVETADYPEWEYNNNSKLRQLFETTYESLYNKKPLIKAIHAGLECGVFAKKIKDLDLISLGPNMYDVHTPDEKVSISSTKRTWEFLLETLKRVDQLVD